MQRNGKLLIELDDAQLKIKELQDEQLGDTIKAKALQFTHLQQKTPLQRPQTAAGRMGRDKLDDMFNEEELRDAQQSFDKELNDLLAKNQKNLTEIHAGFKEISKVSGEPTINVRKIANPAGKRALMQSQADN
jgi:hypothetical protein